MKENYENITSSLQDYLEIILALSESSGQIRVTDIASALNVAKPSVAAAVSQLQKLEMVKHKKYGPIELTELGKKAAVEVRWKHRKIKQFLVEILEVDPETAEKDACLVEHVISPETMMKMAKYLDINRDLK